MLSVGPEPPVQGLDCRGRVILSSSFSKGPRVGRVCCVVCVAGACFVGNEVFTLGWVGFSWRGRWGLDHD